MLVVYVHFFLWRFLSTVKTPEYKIVFKTNYVLLMFPMCKQAHFMSGLVLALADREKRRILQQRFCCHVSLG